MISLPEWNPSVSHRASTTITAMAITAMPSILVTLSISFCRGVASSSVFDSISAILPTWVRIPVLVTIARPVPCVTDVPLKTMLALSPRAFAVSKVVGSLAMGRDSPVRDASATRRLAAANRRPSADTVSPSPKTSTSPGTISAVLTVMTRPSRRTADCGAVIFASASTDCSALASWTYPRIALIIRISTITMQSKGALSAACGLVDLSTAHAIKEITVAARSR